MKKLYVFALCLLMCASLCAQESQIDEKPYSVSNAGVSYTRVITVEGKTASELYSIADNYFTYNYVDANSVVQTQDKEAGTIIGKGLYDELYKYTDGFGFIYCSAIHILRIDCKDGRIRVILTIPNYHLHGIRTSSRPAFDKDINLTDTYPFTGEVAKPSRSQKREMEFFNRVNERAISTIQGIEDYFVNSGNTGVENDDW